MTRKIDSEETGPPRPRKKKTFTLERRCILNIPDDSFDWMRNLRKWHVYREYCTERDLMNAFSRLKNKEPRKWEYRIDE